MPKLHKILRHLFHPQRSNNHRPKVLHHTAYLYFIGTLAIFIAILQSVRFAPEQLNNILGFASSITPAEVITQTNQERTKSGLSELVLSEQLSQAALAKGQDMMTDQYWAHVAPDGTEPWYFIEQAGYTYSVAGENLARDFDDTPRMVDAWMNSPTHRANILNPKYEEIGIAVIDGELEGYETTLVVQLFGKPTQFGAGEQAAGQAPSLPAVADADVTSIIANPASAPQVLAGALVPNGELQLPPLFTPLQLSKAFFLALIMMIIGTLLYDAFVIGHQHTARMVGKNLAHLFFFTAVAYLVIFFKAGLVG